MEWETPSMRGSELAPTAMEQPVSRIAMVGCEARMCHDEYTYMCETTRRQHGCGVVQVVVTVRHGTNVCAAGGTCVPWVADISALSCGGCAPGGRSVMLWVVAELQACGGCT